MEPREDLQSELQKALAECASLREENRRLKELLGLSSQDVVPTLKWGLPAVTG
jgi:cell shape-determining protein MreC